MVIKTWNHVKGLLMQNGFFKSITENNNTWDEIKENYVFDMRGYPLVYDYTKNGMDMRFIVCKNCNHTYHQKKEDTNDNCPACGFKFENHGSKNWFGSFKALENAKERNMALLNFDKEKGFFIFSSFIIDVGYTNDKISKDGFNIQNSDDYDFSKDILFKNKVTQDYYIACANLGMKKISLEEHGMIFLYPIPGWDINLMFNFSKYVDDHYPLVENHCYKEICDNFQLNNRVDVFKHIFGLSLKKSAIETKKKPNKHKDYNPVFFDQDYILNILKKEKNLFSSSLFNTLKEEEEYEVQCFSCGSSFKKIIKKKKLYTENEVICPNCNAKNSMDSKLANFKFQSIDYDKQEECYILGMFDISLRQKIIIQPHYKLFLYKDKSIYIKFNKDEQHLVKSENDYSFYYKNSTGNPIEFLENEEHIKEIVSMGFLKYSGATDIWGMEHNYKKLDDSLYYLFFVSKFPGIEQIYKSKLYELVNLILKTDYIKIKDDFSDIDFSKNNICDILGIDKYLLKIFVEHDLNYTEMIHLKSLYENEKTITIESYKRIIDSFEETYKKNLLLQNSISICQNFKISVNRYLDYLDSAYINQCINKNETVGLYRDYLSMCSQMDIDLSDGSKKFPNSLKKEHDKIAFSFKIVKNEKEEKKFMEVIKSFHYLSYQNKDFQVVIPDVPSEVVREGEKLHHCVASYVKRITDGETCICFIRKIETPDEPFFTVEVKKNAIIQVKGINNCNATSEVRTFISEWAKKINLEKKF